MTPPSNWDTNEMRHVDVFENVYAIRSAIDDKNDEKEEKERKRSRKSRESTVLNTMVSNFFRIYLFFSLVIKTLELTNHDFQDILGMPF